MTQWRNGMKKWQRISLPILAGTFIIGITLFVLWTNAYAGFRTGGAGNCGNFVEAVALAEDGDVVVQMVPARDSGSPVITKNLRLSGGWLPTENCQENNQYFTETSDYLAYGFQYGAPFTRSELFSNNGPVLNLEDTADPGFPNLDQLIIEHLILANTFDFPDNGAGINGTISGSAEILLDNVWLRDNHVSVNGGGINLAVNGGSHLVIEESAFYTNTADNYGGGLTIELRQGSYLTIENTDVISNQALFAGGIQIVVYDTSQVFIHNAHFAANNTTSINGYGGGGQIIMHGGQVTLDNVTFAGNAAGSNEGRGGGLFIQMDGGQMTIKNSRFLNNSAGDGGGLYLESVGSQPATVEMINTRFEGNSPNPYQFVPTGTGDLNTVILDQSIYLPHLLNPSPTPIQSARINQITLDEAFNFVVDFDTFNFTPELPGTHVHFFFDTVAPEDAGVPGPGPWFVYGGTSPFTGYDFTERPFGPDGAEKICVLVANPNHTIRLGSGNCVKLP
jgi:hypothetical protein